MQLWRLRKSKICRWAMRPGIQGRAAVQVQRQSAKNSSNDKTLLAEFPLAWGDQSLLDTGLQLIEPGPPTLWKVVALLSVC